MSAQNVRKRMESLALTVSVFVIFAIAGGVQSAYGSCGDYLNHARSGKIAIFSDMENNSVPLPVPVSVCQGGNCQSAPSQPPIEPSRIVLLRRQPSDFQPLLKSLNSPEVRDFESIDEVLPSSATLEVLTPPPIRTI